MYGENTKYHSNSYIQGTTVPCDNPIAFDITDIIILPGSDINELQHREDTKIAIAYTHLFSCVCMHGNNLVGCINLCDLWNFEPCCIQSVTVKTCV